MKKLPGIFNDVIGPVMRGPSSSHTAASWRIARTCLDILNQPLKKALIEFDTYGAWAPNYREQGTAMGIDGGLLDLAMSDQGIKNTNQIAEARGISITYEINPFPTRHANTVRLSLEGINGKQIQVVAASLGGGSFEIQQINGFNISMYGDYFELIIPLKNDPEKIDYLKSILPKKTKLFISSNDENSLINIKYSKKIPKEIIDQVKKYFDLNEIITIHPTMPIISGNENKMPFSSISSLLTYAKKENLDLAELGLLYEQSQSGLSKTELTNKMNSLIEIIEASINKGLEGTKYQDRILHQQSHLIHEAEKKGQILQDSLVNNIIANVTAIMEAKSAMEVIVANPTAGSCGTVGGVLEATAKDLNASQEQVIKAYFAAGIVGAYFAAGPGFSAEEHGCQVECGAASGMAAAGIAQLFGATAEQAIGAASMAIQNMIGLVCDPVADRVEVPCLGKNISAAMNALSSATMACSGFNAVIPLDEVIETVSRVSEKMPTCVKCTGKGGLAITATSNKLRKNINHLNTYLTS